MSESKLVDDEETHLGALPVVDVTAVDISPNPAALTDELNLEVDFHLSKPVANGVWDIEYLVDSLGQVEATDYARGDNHFQFTAPQIDVTGIEPSQFTNCGLLIASLKGEEEGEIMDLKMVIQVSEQRGELQRIIYSPLE
uniref:Uncharacterized protein n=1 Tax=Globisporangium ultimum (strain ATCC 200006 / CBS 805.95 / DAOM BR144) TaxID=431595 RepID=K3WKE0_GLOUD